LNRNAIRFVRRAPVRLAKGYRAIFRKNLRESEVFRYNGVSGFIRLSAGQPLKNSSSVQYWERLQGNCPDSVADEKSASSPFS
jgi:hypothetical protein